MSGEAPHSESLAVSMLILRSSCGVPDLWSQDYAMLVQFSGWERVAASAGNATVGIGLETTLAIAGGSRAQGLGAMPCTATRLRPTLSETIRVSALVVTITVGNTW